MIVLPRDESRISSRLRTAVLVGAAALLFASVTSAASTPSSRCQAAKNKTAGKYVNCRQRAEAKLATSSEMTTYVTALVKCATKFTTAWQKAIDNAARAGSACLDEPLTAGDFESVVVAHANTVATALAGGGLTSDTCSAVVLETGQVTAYGADSDGSLSRGAARSYTDNGDGTITDNTTGLMWEKKSDDDSIHDVDYSLPWGMTSSPYTMNDRIVTEFLAALNAGGGFAGYTDWRIPNINELLSFANYENAFPAVDTAFNTGCVPGCTVTTCSCTLSSNYWSSTTDQADPGTAWTVGCDVGDSFTNGKHIYNAVRAVRGGS